MHFLNPWYLLGLVLASIPVVIHLLFIRKNKTIEFSSLRFLKELQKTQIRRLKLKQILLLVLRTLIIVFLTLSFARPVVRGDFPFFRNYSNISAVIILDNSISMDVSDEFGNRYRQGKNFASLLLDNFREGDNVCLIKTTEVSQNPSFTSDFQYVKEEIARANISVLQSSYENAFRLAQKLLNESRNLSREIFVISDFQKSALKEFSDSVRFFDPQTTLNLVHIGAKSVLPIDNISIDSVVPLTRIYEPDKKVEFEVFLSNSSNKSYENQVLSLFMNGERIAQRLFNIQTKGRQQVIIAGSVKTKGAVRCLFEIENDALEYDNKRWFGFIVPDILKVGLVSDNKSGFLYRFLQSLDGEKIQLRFIPPNQISTVNLADLSVLFVENLQVDDISAIRDFLSSGKGLFIFPSVSTDGQLLKSFFSNLGFNLDFSYKTFLSNNNPVFTFIDKEHPLFFNVFAPSKEKTIVIPDPPKISNLLTVSSGVALIQTNAGQFLTEFNYQGSKILFCSAAPDLKWGSFPLTSLFPVLIYRSIFYLSEVNELNFSLICGNTLSFNLPASFSRTNLYKLEDPLGNLQQLQSIQLPSGNLLELRDLAVVGTYVLRSGDDLPIGTISVNIDHGESMLDLASKRQVIEFFQKHINSKTKVNYIDETKNIRSSDFRNYSGSELWKLFLFLAIVTSIAEMFVARTTKNEITELK